MANVEEITYRLPMVRGMAHVTPAELARRSDLDVMKIIDIEAGTYSPTRNERRRLADSLDVLREFLDGESWD